MLREMVMSPEARTKGFILDFDYSKSCESTWVTRMIEADLLCGQQLTHAVELVLDDEEVKLRAAGLRQNIDTLQVYSRWERAEIRKPKVRPEGEEDEPEIDDEEDEDAPKLPADTDLFQRVCDAPEHILRDTDYFSHIERPAMDDLVVKLFDQNFIKVDIAGLTPDELSEIIGFKLKRRAASPLRPVATIIEGGAGSFKDLLTEGIEEESGDLPR